MGVLLNGLNKDDRGIFNSPFRRAFRKLNYSVNYSVSDSDFSAIVVSHEEPFLDLSQYYTLEMVYSQNTGVDIKEGDDSQRLSQLADRQKEELDRLREKIENEHSISLGVRKTSNFRAMSLV